MISLLRRNAILVPRFGTCEGVTMSDGDVGHGHAFALVANATEPMLVARSAGPLRHELAGPMIDCNFDAADNDRDGEEHAREVADQRMAATSGRVVLND